MEQKLTDIAVEQKIIIIKSEICSSAVFRTLINTDNVNVINWWGKETHGLWNDCLLPSYICRLFNRKFSLSSNCVLMHPFLPDIGWITS